MIAFTLLHIAILVIVAHCSGCGRAMTPEERATSAEASYKAEHLACVDKSETIEESRECRRRVRLKWNRNPDGSKTP